MKEWKKILFYAIIPAIIAGIFAVAPKLYDEFTEPKAVLEYNITKGPMLRANNGHKSIYAIDVVNNGKKPLSSVLASIKTKGSIEAIDIYESTGLSPKINNDPASVSVETLHPNESFTISLMLVTSKDENNLSFVLRSKEALGKEFKPTNVEKTRILDIISVAGAAFSVFVMAFMFLLRAKSGASITSFISNKPNILYYIAAKSGFLEIINQYGINEGSVTYLRFGDMLFSIAINGDQEKKLRAIIALKCMLVNLDMAEVSKTMIIRNIKNLEGDEHSVDEINLLLEKNENITDMGKQRDCVDAYLANPAEFLTAMGATENA